MVNVSEECDESIYRAGKSS